MTAGDVRIGDDPFKPSAVGVRRLRRSVSRRGEMCIAGKSHDLLMSGDRIVIGHRRRTWRRDAGTYSGERTREEEQMFPCAYKAVCAQVGPLRVLMRDRALTYILCLAILSESACGSVSSTARPFLPLEKPQLPRILVGFSKEPPRGPPPAGTTGWRYRGGGYLFTQKAHRSAQRVAVAYGLRVVTSWPIEDLAADCVIYEIPDGRHASDLLALLAKDPRIAFAQSLQKFHTQASGNASAPNP